MDTQTELKEKLWLVEVRVKNWILVPAGQSRILAYEQVYAVTEHEARLKAWDVFVSRIKYEPIAKRKVSALGITTADICAPDAVAIDDC